MWDVTKSQKFDEIMADYNYSTINLISFNGRSRLPKTDRSLNGKYFSGDKGPYGEPSIHRLIEALDTYIELPKRDMEAPFLMPIDNLVSVPGRGTVAIGKRY